MIFLLKTLPGVAKGLDMIILFYCYVIFIEDFAGGGERFENNDYYYYHYFFF